MDGQTPPEQMTLRFADDDARWEAVVQRDHAADGRFYYAVQTTGIYCQPSCGARLAHREHVRFYTTCMEAEQAGFRPCKRCRPQETSRATRQVEAVAAACRTLATADVTPSLDALAQSTGMSRYHFHRVFKAVTGMTPKAYATAQRAQRVRETLPQCATVTEAIYAAGFNSNGRFYTQVPDMLGMTPSAFRTGGTGVAMRFAVGECSLGSLLVAATDQGVCAILLGDDPEALVRDLQDRFPKAQLLGGDANFERLVATVVGFVEAPARGFDLPLDIRGTAFQQQVWQALRAIPVGATASYTDIAQQIGAPRAVRAVAQACAANHLAVAIPCHRVVRHDGALAGYRWGIERKRALLTREAASGASVPEQ
ncbi:MAG: bifunctional DNA-binding transcriptional regulator/O6-methylguanine-DNA methyltransferase Ada [Candidatus Tectomicrobia bacterium]|uniref:Bifunctional DNA-binding transcriptional regulator/O6-methylguanine-DNA methyltransferase Ada n=1 Tax=Tectimicrobiota bacterium TaxID=2528274 RepID=A0A937VZL6_UNCTE|nr:bifunctional DNA-binding transcriptional regulator/O6-methylguanine-DNA methyltransferase Ada [Candidatus Tectomicrobia bacterium]